MTERAYRTDPGGNLASDTHRRVLGHLPHGKHEPMDLQALGYRISDDRFHELASLDELKAVLDELIADGHASESASGYKATKAGIEVLCAPLPEEPTGPVRPALLQGLEPKSGLR